MILHVVGVMWHFPRGPESPSRELLEPTRAGRTLRYMQNDYDSALICSYDDCMSFHTPKRAFGTFSHFFLCTSLPVSKKNEATQLATIKTTPPNVRTAVQNSGQTTFTMYTSNSSVITRE
jgi:hypothetical protein